MTKCALILLEYYLRTPFDDTVPSPLFVKKYVVSILLYNFKLAV